MCLEIIYLIYIYKKDLALDNLQWLICHETKPCQTHKNQRRKIHENERTVNVLSSSLGIE